MTELQDQSLTDDTAADAGQDAPNDAQPAPDAGDAAPDQQATALTEQDKSSSEAAPNENLGAPDAYDFSELKLPDGVVLDTELAEAIGPALKDLDLSQAAANKLAGVWAEKAEPLIAGRIQQAFQDSAAEHRATMAAELKADTEVGGAKYDEAIATARRAINTALPGAEDQKSFNDMLEATGLGNDRLLVRVLAWAGRQAGEATTTADVGGKTELTAAEKFYGKQGG